MEATPIPSFKLVQRIVFGGFLIGMLLSWKLWISSRLFPMLPPIEGLPAFPNPLDWIVAGLLALTLAAGLVFPHRRIAQAALGLTLVLALQDQMRWQPWVYTYMLLLLPFAFQDFSFASKKEQPVSPVLLWFQIFLAGLYFWGGVHKLNDNFVDVIYPLFAISLFKAKEGSFLLEPQESRDQGLRGEKRNQGDAPVSTGFLFGALLYPAPPT